MKMSELILLQKKFDGNHKGKFNWDQKITDDNVHLLDFLIISLVGEVGEFSNIVKKIHRGDVSFTEVKKSLSEELIDIFIYLMKISYQCDIDIEGEYLKKLSENRTRFCEFER